MNCTSLSVGRSFVGVRENRGREGYGRREEKGGKRNSQGGGNREKRRKTSQYCITFYNRHKTIEAGTPSEGGGKREQKVREAGVSDPPVSPHKIVLWWIRYMLIYVLSALRF